MQYHRLSYLTFFGILAALSFSGFSSSGQSYIFAYGTTPNGGMFGAPAVFQLDPVTGNGTLVSSGGILPTTASNLVVESDGNILCYGSSFSIGNTIVRINPNTQSQQTLWTQPGFGVVVPVGQISSLTTIATTPDGRIFAYGTTPNGGMFGAPAVFQLDPVTGNGTLISSGGLLPTTPYGIAIEADGNILCYGSSFSIGNTIVRINPNTQSQQTLWTQPGFGVVVPVGQISSLTTIATTPDGRIFAYGTTPNGGMFGAPAVFQLDPVTGNGTLISSGGLLPTTPYGIAIEADGNILCYGSSFSIGNTIVRINPNTQSQQTLWTQPGFGVVVPVSQISSLTTIAVAPFITGIDISYSGVIVSNGKTIAPSVQDFQNIKAQDYYCVVVEGWTGTKVNPYANTQLSNARAAGLLTAGYCYLNFATNLDGATQVYNALKQFGPEAAYLGFVAIDVENGDTSQLPTALRGQSSCGCSAQNDAITRILQAVACVNQVGLKPVIYSSQNPWIIITGNTTLLADLPLWNPKTISGIDITMPSLNGAPNTFGGWTNRAGKQYILDTTDSPNVLVNPPIHVDDNVFLNGIFALTNPNYNPFDLTPTIKISGNNLVLTWNNPFVTLQQVPLNADLTSAGPWTASPSQTSPVTISPTGQGMFFRLY